MAELNIYPTAEGVFLMFETEDGKSAAVSAEVIAATLPLVARATVLKWCEEIEREAVADVDETGLLSPLSG
jgi:hypothetical protein